MMKNSNSKRIPCNSLLKEYNTKNLQRIANMGCGEIYSSLKATGGIVTRKCIVCKTLAETLIKKIPEFLPSEPKLSAELQKMRQFQEIWLTHLRTTIERISQPAKPVYLADEVTRVLQAKGYKGRCENIHLEWYLSRHKGMNMTPDKIASDIIIYDGTDWSNVKHLIKDDAYHIRMQDPAPSADNFDNASAAEVTSVQPQKRSYIRGKYDDVTKVFEFIYSLPSTPGIETLEERLRNDIQVANELAAWRKEETQDYDYKVKYQEFINRLQTLPPAAKKIKFRAAAPTAVKEEKTEDSLPESREQPDGVYTPTGFNHQPIPAVTPPTQHPYSFNITHRDEEYEAAKHRFNSGYTLDESDQLAILRHGKCPSCGKDVKEIAAGKRADGSTYAAFIACSGGTICKFTAGGTIQAPQINRNRQITPREDREALL